MASRKLATSRRLQDEIDTMPETPENFRQTTVAERSCVVRQLHILAYRYLQSTKTCYHTTNFQQLSPIECQQSPPTNKPPAELWKAIDCITLGNVNSTQRACMDAGIKHLKN